MMPDNLVELPAKLKAALEEMPGERASIDVIRWATAAYLLVRADDAEEIRELETFVGCTQEEAVTHYVEYSCWSDDMREYSGGKGTPQERLAVLRALWEASERGGAEDGHG